jgi:hypothetical protein
LLDGGYAGGFVVKGDGFVDGFLGGLREGLAEQDQGGFETADLLRERLHGDGGGV